MIKTYTSPNSPPKTNKQTNKITKTKTNKKTKTTTPTPQKNNNNNKQTKKNNPKRPQVENKNAQQRPLIIYAKYMYLYVLRVCLFVNTIALPTSFS